MADDKDKNDDKTGDDLPKSRKIQKKDWDKVSTHLKTELQKRKDSEFRQQHERIWKEVDRQVAMQSMVKINRDNSEADTGWHNVFELGELSKASEEISADVRRIVFPENRAWFDAHCDIPQQMTENGPVKIPQKAQSKIDGRIRALMMQQHADFGLKDRVELSVKEALHHGSFVAEVQEDSLELIFDGSKIKSIKSPVWIPHSMWNCYPDPSPRVIGASMFYEGSMFIESFMPRYLAERMVKSGKGDGWMPSQWAKVSKDEHKVKDQRIQDVKIVTYWGDVNIERKDGDLYYPNHKAILMNGTIVYMAPNKTPYPPIIYRGYERLDVRDPYYMSPIIKMSPMQKLSTTLANKFMDGVELKLEPPIVYDGNDPDFVLNNGPIIEPGAKVSSKGAVAFKEIQIGDPGVALEGLQLCLAEMKDKLGRPTKKGASARTTATEIDKMDADEEISLVNFIDKMEVALRSFLYMQHSMNLDSMESYSFYSPETDDDDFIRLAKKDLPKEIHFEVVGARGVLGERQRTQLMAGVTSFAASNPLFQPMLDAKQILIQMYQDAGVKNPERFIAQQANANPALLMQQLMQTRQQLQKVGQLLQQEKQKSQVKMAKIQADHADKTKKMTLDHTAKMTKIAADFEAKMKQHNDGIKMELRQMLEERFKEGMKLMHSTNSSQGVDNSQ